MSSEQEATRLSGSDKFEVGGLGGTRTSGALLRTEVSCALREAI